MKYLLMLLLLFPSVALGGDRCPPPVEPVQEETHIGGSNHNALAIGLFIAAGICVYHQCWKEKQTVVRFKGKQEKPE